MEIKNVTIIGGGTMGNGIAHVFAWKGFNVNLVETSEQLYLRAFNTISQNLDRQVKKTTISEIDKKMILDRINKVISIENIPINSDLIIEAIYENKESKCSIFNKLDKIIKPDSIFASNTSSISITELAASCRPDRFIGMHFMNPVPIMKLIEIIRGYSTSDETFNTIKQLSEKLDKVPVEVKTAFHKKFPDVTKVTYEMEKADYEISFKMNGTECSANFDKTGKWLETETELKEDQIPTVVKATVTKEFPLYVVKEPIKVETPDVALIYEFDISKGSSHYEIEITPDGTLIKKKVVTKEDVDGD